MHEEGLARRRIAFPESQPSLIFQAQGLGRREERQCPSGAEQPNE